MSMKLLMASAYITTLGLIACPLQVFGQEIVRAPRAAVSHVAQGQKSEADQDSTASQPRKESAATQTTQREASLADIREIYDPMLETQMTAAEPVGFLGRMIGGPSAKMIGAWSGSSAECASNRLLFFEDANARPTVAWWTQPLSLKGGGLIPSLTGQWEIREKTLVMSFDEATIVQPFTGGSVSTRETDISVRLEVVHDDGDKLMLGVPDGNLTLAAAEILEGTGTKSFIRCTGP